MTEQEKRLLRKELTHLEKAAALLAQTFSKCEAFGIKGEYSFLELVFLEALTSRFARLSDLLIRKIFRLIHQLDYEPQETVRDSINRAEKLGLIQSTSLFSQIRETRNAIAHEYLIEDLTHIYKSVFTHTPELLETIDRVKSYCMRYES